MDQPLGREMLCIIHQRCFASREEAGRTLKGGSRNTSRSVDNGMPRTDLSRLAVHSILHPLMKSFSATNGYPISRLIPSNSLLTSCFKNHHALANCDCPLLSCPSSRFIHSASDRTTSKPYARPCEFSMALREGSGPRRSRHCLACTPRPSP